MATEQVSTNTAQGKGNKAREEYERLDSVQDRLIFLQEIFEALGSTSASEYQFSPFAFTGLALVVEDLKDEVSSSLEVLEGFAREMEAANE